MKLPLSPTQRRVRALVLLAYAALLLFAGWSIFHHPLTDEQVVNTTNGGYAR